MHRAAGNPRFSQEACHVSSRLIDPLESRKLLARHGLGEGPGPDRASVSPPPIEMPAARPPAHPSGASGAEARDGANAGASPQAHPRPNPPGKYRRPAGHKSWCPSRFRRPAGVGRGEQRIEQYKDDPTIAAALTEIKADRERLVEELNVRDEADTSEPVVI